MFMLVPAFLGAFAIFSSLSWVDAAARGLAWATDNSYAPHIARSPRIKWYHREWHPFLQIPCAVLTTPLLPRLGFGENS